MRRRPGVEGLRLDPPEEDAATHQNATDLDQQQVNNAVILGGAITPEHRTVIVECIEGNPVTR